jgi:hypothetical protein
MYREKYGIDNMRQKFLTDEFLAQLEACKDDASRRLLLGKSIKEKKNVQKR